MPAVVRVKRRIDEEPHSAFVLNGKKRRIDGNNAGGATETTQDKDDISTVLKFAGTINSQDDAATKEIAARLTKDSAKQMVQKKTTSRQQLHVSPTERLRKELREAQSEQRFRVVNCRRATHNEDESLGAVATTSSSSATNTDNENNTQQSSSAKEASSCAAVTIVDIEPAAAEAAANATNIQQASAVAASTLSSDLPADSDTGYVYDLYIPENEEEAGNVDLMDDNYLSVRLYDSLTFDDCFEYDDDEYDSEDSNQENYYTNEYPDEDDDDRYDMYDAGYDHLSALTRNLCLDDDDNDVDYSNEPSSSDETDDYNDGYVNIHKRKTVQNDDDDVDEIDSYGNYYDRYHKRILNEINNDDKKIVDKHDDYDLDDNKDGKDHTDSPMLES